MKRSVFAVLSLLLALQLAAPAEKLSNGANSLYANPDSAAGASGTNSTYRLRYSTSDPAAARLSDGSSVVRTMFLQSRPPGANEFFVGPSGADLPANGTASNPWKTIKYAVTIAKRAGDIIHVLPGTYGDDNLPFTVPAGVKVIGEPMDRTAVVIQPIANLSVLITMESGSTLESLTVRNILTPSGLTSLINTGGPGVEINNCVVDNNYTDAYGGSVIGIMIDQANCSVRRSLIYSSSGQGVDQRDKNTGIKLSGMSRSFNNTLISGNELRALGVALYCMSFSSGATVNINKNTIVNCNWGFLGHLHLRPTTYNIVDNIFAWPDYNSNCEDVRIEAFTEQPIPYNNNILVNFDYNCSYNVSNNIMAGTFVPGENNLVAYPWFVRPRSNDYHLFADSPCKGTAHDGGNRGAYDGYQPTTFKMDVNPPIATLEPGAVYDRFFANCRDDDGFGIPGVNIDWSVTNEAAGTIAPTGKFTAKTTLGIYPGIVMAATQGLSSTFNAFASVNIGGVGKLAGQVTDEITGLGIVDAIVSVEGSTAQMYAAGYYSINGIRPGTYLARASAGGYLSAAQLVTIEVNKTTTQNFCLTRSNVPYGTVPLTIARQGENLRISWNQTLYPNPQLFVLQGDGSGQFTNEMDGWVSLATYSQTHPDEIDDPAGLRDGRIVHNGQVGAGVPELYYKAVKADIVADDLPTIIPTAWAVGKVNIPLQGTVANPGKNLIATPLQTQQGMGVAAVLGEGAGTIWEAGDMVQSKIAASPAYKTAIYIDNTWRDAASPANSPSFNLNYRFGNWVITKADKTLTVVGAVLSTDQTVKVYGGGGLTTGGKTLLGTVFPVPLGLSATSLVADGARNGDLIQYKLSPLTQAYISAVVSSGAWKNAANPSDPLDPRIATLTVPNSYIYVRFGDGADAGFTWRRTKP
jgi:hypothetical protein